MSFAVPGAGVRLTAARPGQVALRRFATAATVPIGALPVNRPVELRIPPDRSSRRWRLSISPGTGLLSVCGLR